MFDFSKIADLVTGLAQSALSDGPAGVSQEWLGVLEANGIDPSTLAGLSPDQLSDVLTGLGVDPTQFLPSDLQELASGLEQFDLSSLTNAN